jgi:hypothetical protein
MRLRVISDSIASTVSSMPTVETGLLIKEEIGVFMTG